MREPPQDLFATTRWTLVLAAGGSDPVAKRAALASLCAAYWKPIFEYIRRRGNSDDASKDLTQEFFARLLEHDWLSGLTKEGSKFRAFLLVAVKRFLAVEHERQTAQKRGGGVAPFPINVGEVAQAVAVGETPERAFDRRWALTVIDRAIERLRAEAKASGRGALFAQVARFLSVEPEAGGYDAVAADLGMSRASVAMAVHRLRLRLREQVRAEIAQTLADPRQLETEMQELMACLRG